eukprot:TRINITY_DN3543_c0_g1_i7.p1 TRINITY_DN3543_c0_g1~~TRINITY_DN3543_c0_g1_i7.p1  ORF type:complete len:1036 (-),score=213.29 TRINITY_DN3543_c0_g1_i7:116-3223(-)
MLRSLVGSEMCIRDRLHTIMAFKPSKSNYMSTFVPVLWRLLDQRKQQLKQQQQGDNKNNNANPWDFETSSQLSSIHRVDSENMDVAASFGAWIADLLHVSLALERHDSTPSITTPAVTAVLNNKGCLSRGGSSGNDGGQATLTPKAAAGGGHVLPSFGRVSSLAGTPPQGDTTTHNSSPQQPATAATSTNNMNPSATNLEQLFKDLQVETQERRDGQGLLHWATTATYVGDCITCGGGRGLLPCQCTSCCQAHLEVIPQLLLQATTTTSTTTIPVFTNTGTGMFLISNEFVSSCMNIASEQNKITAAAQYQQHQAATINMHVSDLPPPLTRVATSHFSDGDMSMSGDVAPPTTTTKQQQQQSAAMEPSYLSDDQLCKLALLVAASRDGITAPHHPSAIHTLYLLQSLTAAHQQQQQQQKTTTNSNSTFTAPTMTPPAAAVTSAGTSISQIRHLLFEGERHAMKSMTTINPHHRYAPSGTHHHHDNADSEHQSSGISTPHTAHLHGGTNKSSIVAIRIPRTPQQDGLRTMSFQSVGLGITPREEGGDDHDGGDHHLPAAPSLGTSFAFQGGGASTSQSHSNFGTPSLAFASIPNNASFASLPRNSPALPPLQHPGATTTTYHHAPLNLRHHGGITSPTETPTLSPANHSLLHSTTVPSHMRTPLDLNAPYISNTSFGSAPSVLLPPASSISPTAPAASPPPPRAEETALLEITSLVHTYIREPLSAAVEKIILTKLNWSTSQSHNDEGWMDSVTVALINWIASSVFAHCVSELSTAVSHNPHQKKSSPTSSSGASIPSIGVIVRSAIHNWFRDVINVPTTNTTTTTSPHVAAGGGYIGLKLPNPNTTPEALLLLSVCHSPPSSSTTQQSQRRMRSLTSLESSIKKSTTTTASTAYHPQRALQDAAVGAHLMSLREVQDSLLEEKLDAEERFIQGVGVGREVIEARERRERGGGDDDENMNVDDEEGQPSGGNNGEEDNNLSPSRRDSVVDIQNSDADSDEPPDAGGGNPLGISSEITTPITSVSYTHLTLPTKRIV